MGVEEKEAGDPGNSFRDLPHLAGPAGVRGGPPGKALSGLPGLHTHPGPVHPTPKVRQLVLTLAGAWPPPPSLASAPSSLMG